MRVYWVLGLAVLLGGCSTAQQGVDYLLDLGDFGRSAGEEQKVVQQRPLYCYRTLGREECYAQPLPDREIGRLVEFYGPPPSSLTNGGAARP
ncbi:MAG: hypothetical protein NXI16_09895 [Alphaproteobacteria bacterium]|nr:hypothetical protein [Alphaproteobacteria bacterium]